MPRRSRYAQAPVQSAVPAAWETVKAGLSLNWYDEFEGNSLDTSKWQPNWLGASNTTKTKGINSASDCGYDPANVIVSGGSCNLRTKSAPGFVAATGQSYSYSSGCITTYGKKSFGMPFCLQVRANMAGSAGVINNWPAIWLNASQHVSPGGAQGWPTGGEIDVMEGLGGVAKSNYHYNATAGSDTPAGSSAYSGNCTGWHTWEVVGNTGVLYFILDGTLVRTYSHANVVNAQRFIVLNQEMSASLGGPNTANNDFLIDFVRLYL